MPKKDLNQYTEKRHFKVTPEPKPKLRKSSKDPIFVVQEHSARSHHYDFRIEAEGVLKSWAVPKGPPLNINEKRLAIQTEDHPLDYGSFEGEIPKGEYGAGKVIIWDKGSYTNLKDIPIWQCIKNGEITIELHGKKLKGHYAIVKTNLSGETSWLMIKMKH